MMVTATITECAETEGVPVVEATKALIAIKNMVSFSNIIKCHYMCTIKRII